MNSWSQDYCGMFHSSLSRATRSDWHGQVEYFLLFCQNYTSVWPCRHIRFQYLNQMTWAYHTLGWSSTKQKMRVIEHVKYWRLLQNGNSGLKRSCAKSTTMSADVASINNRGWSKKKKKSVSGQQRNFLEENVNYWKKKDGSQSRIEMSMLRKFGMSTKIRRNFYSCIVESVLTNGNTVWYGSFTAANHKRLQRVVKTARVSHQDSTALSAQQLPPESPS